jgi:hypothetical protein
MLKKWIAKLTLIALSIGVIVPLQAYTSSSSRQIEILEASYANGEYDTFLAELDEQYKRAGKAGVLRGLFESVKKVNKDESVSAQVEAIRATREQRDKERNRRLQEIATANPDLEISQKIQSLTSSPLSEQEKQILKELSALKIHIPEDTAPTIENKISALETEYHIKMLLLRGALFQSKTPSDNLHQKLQALTLQKFDRMEKAAKEYQSQEWMEKIAIAKEANHHLSVSAEESKELFALVTDAREPQNAVEEKVKQVMMDYINEWAGSPTELVQK